MVDDDGQGVVRDIDVLAVGEINPDIVFAGAGDSFDAGFSCTLLEGQPLEGCLRLAAVCGASSVEQHGGVDGQPTRAEAGSLLVSWTAGTL